MGTAPVVADDKLRPAWPVFLWVVGGFLVGVLLNGGIEAAGIAITDWSTDWEYRYRASWFWSLLPYAVALSGLFIGLARRRKNGRNPHKRLAIAVATMVAIGIGVVLLDAYEEASSTENLDAFTATTTASTQPTTSTTDTFQRIAYCRKNVAHDSDCDGEISLRYLVVDHYWIEEWVPLWEDVREAAEANDERRARLLCELAFDDREGVEARVRAWPPGRTSHIRSLAVDWLQEMEIQLSACALGEWGTVNESHRRSYDYLQDFCGLAGGCSSLASNG